MVSVSEATAIIQSHLFSPAIETIPITDAVNRILSQTIKADRDFPPFNRVAMDGIAIQCDQFVRGRKEFKIEGTAQAGQPQQNLLNNENCLEVMTGAPLPKKTDTVIRYEDLEINSGKATVLASSIVGNQNVHHQGQDARENDILLKPNLILSPAEIALLATVGIAKVGVKTLPKTAIISTGDELIAVHETPEAHQIRRSNSYALQSILKYMGCQADQFHLPDSEEKLKKEISRILEDHDLLILSGGVSKGKFDFVPEVLNQLGAKKHFHKVWQKPGKPFWFGTLANKTIFALPGNPVSTYLCFYKYIKPWLMASLGATHPTHYALLASDFKFGGDVTYFLQVKVVNENGKLIAYPVPGGGSGDLANLKEVNAFLELPPEQHEFKKGAPFPIHLFRQV